MAKGFFTLNRGLGAILACGLKITEGAKRLIILCSLHHKRLSAVPLIIPRQAGARNSEAVNIVYTAVPAPRYMWVSSSWVVCSVADVL